MGGELWLYLAGRAERRLVQRVKILADCARCVCRIDLGNVPLILGRRVLFVRVRLNQAGINRHTLATHQPFRDAARNGRLEETAQDFTLPETAVSILRKRRVIRHRVVQITVAEMA